ncbi:MAG: SDR family NAD(P)-dependent oxidoreductase [Candidatus Binatia bacterium]
MSPAMRLQDRVAIITGAGQGIGKAYAARFLREGARVVIAEASKERGEQAEAELSRDGEAVFVRTDVSDETSAEACARSVADRFGRIDVLVNNAALFYDFDRTDDSFEYLLRVFRVNLHGMWLMARAVSPAMVERRFGRIVNVSSSAAYIHPSFDEPFAGVHSWGYNQTKWGVVGLTQFLAGQLGQYGVTANCIAPGVTLSEATKKSLTPERIEVLRAQSALKRTLRPEDLTGAVVFFASDDAELVTGQVLCVDAGLCMPA